MPRAGWSHVQLTPGLRGLTSREWRAMCALLCHHVRMQETLFAGCREHLEVSFGDAMGQVLDQQHGLAALHASLEAACCMATCLGGCLQSCHVSASIRQGRLCEGYDVSLPEGHAHW